MTHRAYSLLTVKAIDEDAREITGIATTPTADLYSDIVEPKGAEFKLPIPLLMQHDHKQPIGHVIAAKVTASGIEIRAKLVKVDEPGKLKDRLDEAWQSLKAGLVRGLSIGFTPIESARIEGTYGYRFIKWLWNELSAVVVAANTECTITGIKSIDTAQRAASGRVQRGAAPPKPGDSGSPTKPATGGFFHARGTGMNIQEQIKQWEAKRAAAAAAMENLMKAAADEGRELNAEEEQTYDDAATEVKGCDKHLIRLKDLEKVMVKAASPVRGDNPDAGSQARDPHVLALKPKLEKGIEFARYVMCLGSAKGNLPQAYEIAKSRFADSPNLHIVLKAAVNAGTTTDATWANPLVEYNQFAGDFVEYLRPMTIIGKFGVNGVPDLMRIPFNVHIRGQISGGSGYWVGQGLPKPVTKFDFNDTYLGWAKVANIAVLTEELLRFSNPSAEVLVRRALADALIERLDTDFVDPNKAVETNVSPASITNGSTSVASSGTTAAAVRTDINNVTQILADANISLMGAVWIMPTRVARAIALMRTSLGVKEFPDMTMSGGFLEGLPVIVSDYVTNSSNGGTIILASAPNIWLADDNQVVVDASREASLQMLDNPTNTPQGGTIATTMVSMFQTNSVALRAERWINWSKRRAAAVGYITGANYVPS